MTMSSDKTTPTQEVQFEAFEPERQGSSAEVWLAKVETFARENHLSEDQMYSFAQGKLGGDAKEWLAGSKVTDWDEFRQAIVVAFPGGEAVDRRHRPLERRRRMPNESVHEYIEQMRKLGKRGKLSEATVVRHIVAGLGDSVLSKAIPQGAGFEQLLKAIEWQKEVEDLMKKYTASEETVDSFEKLADEMEGFVMDDGNFSDVIKGDDEVLGTISAELNSIMQQNRSSLSCSLFDLGTSKTHQIVVNLVHGALIDADKTVPPSEAHKGLLQTSVISLLTCDVIQKSAAAHLRPARHTDSELLLDLSHLNAICRRESPNFLLPQQLLAGLSAFRYFTLLDFNGGHLQIPLEPGRTRSYFAFSTPFGAFEFQRAPRNFANTTIIFNKILIELARKLRPGDAVVLNDVLVVPARHSADGLQKLSRVLAALGAFGLTADLRRSRFFERHIKLFNWTVQHGKVISTGLPFEPGHPGQRLTLLITVSEDAATCRAALRRRTDGNCTHQTIGCFLRTAREPDRTSLVLQCLADSIEHFRQFLLFASFEVVLEKGAVEEREVRRRLLQVQQFDFKLIQK